MDKNKRIIIDFGTKKTEQGWIEILDAFALDATAIWFDWIGWILAITALQYLFQKSNNLLIGIIIGISIALLFLYFNAFFFRIEFKNLIFLKHERIKKNVSLVVSGLLAFGFWRLSIYLIQIITKNQ
ncbi:MAG: hypothetical protein LHV68_09210 [Elusimicrobia bacterium]|nr:hypothetical protein [Candidatus Liberimonas magnetica]